MSSCPRCPEVLEGRVDALNRIRQARTNLKPWNNSNPAGERQRRILKGRVAVKYSFTIYSLRSSAEIGRFIFGRVCAASITTPAPAERAAEARCENLLRTPLSKHCSNPINAFLTLAAVTERRRAEPGFAGGRGTRENTWQPCKFHVENGVCGWGARDRRSRPVATFRSEKPRKAREFEAQ